MSETSKITLRIDSALKKEAEMPFRIKIPNKTTVKTFTDTAVRKNLIKCEDTEDMFRKLGI